MLSDRSPLTAERLNAALWYAAGFLILLLLPSLHWGLEPVWMLPRDKLVEAAFLPVAFGAGALVLFIGGWRQRCSLTVRCLVSALVIAALFAIYLDRGVTVSRAQLAAVSGLCAIFLLGPPTRWIARATSVLAALVVALVLVILGWIGGDDWRGLQTTIHTTYHAVQATYYPRLGRSIHEGGGLALLGDGYLVVSGDGAFYHLEWDGDYLRSRRLALAAPLERARFAAETPAKVNPRLFRVAHLVLRPSGDLSTIYVSHHAWDSERKCFSLRVAVLEAPVLAIVNDNVEPNWSTMFETQPCLPLKDRSFPFAGLQNGGRMALLDEEWLLLTVGDHEFDGIYSDVALPQALDNDYGKTMRISLADGSAEVFTIGHRNPQGLNLDAEGEIWLTEHGPAGGDELNRLEAGSNYGWPLHTYGVDYEEGSQPYPEPDKSLSLVMPDYSWLPSIGISNLIDVRGNQFEHWSGDLLVSSLRAQSLYRVHRRDGSVAYVEPIEIGERIRDLIEDGAGRILLWTDAGKVVVLTTAILSPAELIFRHCLNCHSLDDRAAIGPNLVNIVGRPVASVAGYPYSTALRSLGGRWTEEKLNEFLKNPAEFAPGTTMVMEGVIDDSLRAEIIQMLQ
jgi:aldose sugar dehydrogenase